MRHHEATTKTIMLSQNAVIPLTNYGIAWCAVNRKFLTCNAVLRFLQVDCALTSGARPRAELQRAAPPSRRALPHLVAYPGLTPRADISRWCTEGVSIVVF